MSIDKMWIVDNYHCPNVIHIESVKRLEKRIQVLENALENLMDAYQFMVGFDENYEKAQKVIKKTKQKSEK